jgi:hypothetical protein
MRVWINVGLPVPIVRHNVVHVEVKDKTVVLTHDTTFKSQEEGSIVKVVEDTEF